MSCLTAEQMSNGWFVVNINKCAKFIAQNVLLHGLGKVGQDPQDA